MDGTGISLFAGPTRILQQPGDTQEGLEARARILAVANRAYRVAEMVVSCDSRNDGLRPNAAEWDDIAALADEVLDSARKWVRR